jgi:hypothetical protein
MVNITDKIKEYGSLTLIIEAIADSAASRRRCERPRVGHCFACSRHSADISKKTKPQV